LLIVSKKYVSSLDFKQVVEAELVKSSHEDTNWEAGSGMEGELFIRSLQETYVVRVGAQLSMTSGSNSMLFLIVSFRKKLKLLQISWEMLP
jgi:hypothetical protein